MKEEGSEPCPVGTCWKKLKNSRFLNVTFPKFFKIFFLIEIGILIIIKPHIEQLEFMAMELMKKHQLLVHL